MTKAYILGFQGESITNKSVECMPKHFTGNGPVEKGLDSHFPSSRNVYPGKIFNYHLIPFEKGVFPANIAQLQYIRWANQRGWLQQTNDYRLVAGKI